MAQRLELFKKKNQGRYDINIFVTWIIAVRNYHNNNSNPDCTQKANE